MPIGPGALLVAGLITGIGGAVTYATFHYLQSEGDTSMKTEAERKASHERIFGKVPPAERLGRGQTVNDLLPMPPEEGPPLPRMFALKWPWRK